MPDFLAKSREKDSPMELKMRKAAAGSLYPRTYVASARLANFRGHRDVEVHIFRYGYPESEIDDLGSLDLVGPPDPGMPPELIANATRESALKCVLEAFTEEEAVQLTEYLDKRYKDQITQLIIAPLELPAPLGVGPLAEIPEGETSGFIKFDKAPGYDLPFRIRAYYELPTA